MYENQSYSVLSKSQIRVLTSLWLIILVCGVASVTVVAVGNCFHPFLHHQPDVTKTRDRAITNSMPIDQL